MKELKIFAKELPQIKEERILFPLSQLVRVDGKLKKVSQTPATVNNNCFLKTAELQTAATVENLQLGARLKLIIKAEGNPAISFKSMQQQLRFALRKYRNQYACLYASTKFFELSEVEEIEDELAKAGYVCISVNLYNHASSIELAEYSFCKDKITIAREKHLIVA